MGLREMPATWPDDKYGWMIMQIVTLTAFSGEIDAAINCIAQVDLAPHYHVPGRRCGVLKIRHEDIGPGIQRIDNHLRINWSGYLHPPVQKFFGQGGRFPVVATDSVGLCRKSGEYAAVHFTLPLLTHGKQFPDPGCKQLHQFRHEIQGIFAQDLRVIRIDMTRYFNTGRRS